LVNKVPTSHKLLAKNTAWNLIGQLAPLFAAFFAMPLLVSALGIHRFGVLTLAWVVIGYFSLFDFGIGRALTKVVADRLGSGQIAEIPALIWSAMAIMALLGVCGGAVVGVLSPWLVQRVLEIPLALHAETLNTFLLLALSLPIVITTAGLRGVLEAYQRFDLINLIRIPMGLFTFLGPLLVLPFSNNLALVVAVLVIGRLIAWVVHLAFCVHAVPELRRRLVVRRDLLGPLFRFGGWLTISNVVGPVIVYLDRFLIGAVLSVAAVGYYTAPYEIVTKLLLIPAALTAVLFPVFAAGLVAHPELTRGLFVRGVKVIFLLLFPLALFFITFAHEGLQFWLGPEFALNGGRVLQWLAAGMFVNSLAQVALTMVQAAGRPDLSAKLHLAELPVYSILLWLLTARIGIEGAAIAWTLRAGVDMVLLFWFVKRILPVFSTMAYSMLAVLLMSLAVLVVAALLTGILIKVLFTILVLGAFALVGWMAIVSAEERGFVESRLRGWLGRA